MDARYRFAIRLRIETDARDAWIDPASFDTTLYKTAPTPGEDGWQFFRDHLWRGEVNDQGHARDLAEEALGVPVELVEFRAFETDDEYLEALREEIAADLEAFRADSVDEVLSKYLGSSIEVTNED